MSPVVTPVSRLATLILAPPPVVSPPLCFSAAFFFAAFEFDAIELSVLPPALAGFL